jgi:hypothetical protein
MIFHVVDEDIGQGEMTGKLTASTKDKITQCGSL